APSSTFVVGSTGGTPDAVPGNGACDDGSGACTLRAAIQEANALSGSDIITFALGAGTSTIAPLTPLPGITGTVSVQGKTGGATRIQLNGGPVGGAGVNGLLLAAGSSGSLVRSLVMNRFSRAGLRIESANNTVEDCWIGVIGGTTTADRNVIVVPAAFR